MDEKDRRSTYRRAADLPRKIAIDTANDAALRPATTLWRMRTAAGDSQASCSVNETINGCDVIVIFTRGLGIAEHFGDVAAAMRHSMEIAGRLMAQGWIEIDLRDD
jgi:hypothetical protein